MRTIFDDAAAHPRLFLWFGAPSADQLRAVSAAFVQLPQGLLHFWKLTGGGDVFESETILGPAGINEDNVLAATRRLQSQGLSKDYCLFHRGLTTTVVDLIAGRFQVVDEKFRPLRSSIETFDDWYESVLRKEYAQRYGL
jgi:hypothetical protein